MSHYRAGRKQVAVLLALLSSLLCVTPASAQAPFEPVPAGLSAGAGLYDGGVTDARNIELLNHLPGGPEREIEVQSDYAYALIGNIIEVFDISDPTAPRLVGTLPTGLQLYFEPTHIDLVLHEAYGYLIGEWTIWSFGLDDPARPTWLHGTPLGEASTGWASSVEMQGDYLYVTTAKGHLLILQVQPDGSLEQVGDYHAAEGDYLYGLAIDGDVGYLNVPSGDGDKRHVDLQVIDLSDPATPELVTTIEGGGNFKVEVTENRLYILELGANLSSYSLIAYDRTNPWQPKEIGRFTTAWNYDPTLAAPFVFIAWGDYVLLSLSARLEIIDFSLPLNPRHSDASLETLAFTVEDSRAYILADGLHIFDLTALPALDEMGAYATLLNGLQALHLHDRYAFIKGSEELYVLDVISPTQPSQVATLPEWATGNIRRLIAGDTRLYGDERWDYGATAYYNNKSIIDIADPLQPEVVGSFTVAAMLQTVVGDTAYLLNHEDGADMASLLLMDISTPDQWQELGSLMIPGPATSLVVNDGRAYLLTPDGMAVVDVSTASQPRLLGTYPAVWTPGLLLHANDYLYIVGQGNQQNSSLQIVEITDTDRPVVRRTIQLGDNGRQFFSDATWEAPYLYVLAPRQGLYVVDMADPTQPLEAGRYHLIPDAGTVTTSGELIGVTHGYGAASLYRFTPPDETVRVDAPVIPAGMAMGDVIYTLPDGFVSTPISLTHAPRMLGPSSVTPPLAATELVFRNSATDPTTGDLVEPDAAYTMTISYAGISGPFPPETLTLFRWTGDMWQAQESSVDMENQEVTATTEHFGIFALMAKPHQLRLPYVRTDHSAVPSR